MVTLQTDTIHTYSLESNHTAYWKHCTSTHYNVTHFTLTLYNLTNFTLTHWTLRQHCLWTPHTYRTLTGCNWHTSLWNTGNWTHWTPEHKNLKNPTPILWQSAKLSLIHISRLPRLLTTLTLTHCKLTHWLWDKNTEILHFNTLYTKTQHIDTLISIHTWFSTLDKPVWHNTFAYYSLAQHWLISLWHTRFKTLNYNNPPDGHWVAALLHTTH